MTKKEYADVLRWAIKTQVGYFEEDWKKKDYEDDFLDGVIRGLKIALEKIDASAFLYENEGVA